MTPKSGLARRVYLCLTSSERDRLNRTDFVSQKDQAMFTRNRIHSVNDVFHDAGNRSKWRSADAINLQSKGLAWSFLIFPALFLIAVVALITQPGLSKRNQTIRELRENMESRSVTSEREREEATARLRQTQQELERLKQSSTGNEEYFQDKMEELLHENQELLDKVKELGNKV